MEHIEKVEEGMRLDQFMMDVLSLSRSKVQSMIKENQILVNDCPSKNGYQLKANDQISYEPFVEKEMKLIPEKLDFEIVYEDNDVIVVNKPNGMVVHPAVGNFTGTLVNGLLYHSKELSDINGEFRPGIVHRIDAFTTGLLVVAKNNRAHEFLAHQLEEHSIHRKYEALVWGVIEEDSATIKAPIGRDLKDRKKMAVTSIHSKEAITHLKVLKRMKHATLIECVLETGRTHQIRVHLNYIGHPVVNDPIYGNRKPINDTGQCLHAKELGFIHPTTKEYMEFHADLPTEFLEILEKFENE